ncbi:hypothetical protein ONZ45_g820 [Pleurotus djamor]|nr:hypothetical protein ONZ45_g820 [Pleurotus djamor]
MTGINPEAFLLLSLENARLRTPTNTFAGVLGLQCVTVTIPVNQEKSATGDTRDVFLVFSIGGYEAPIDPTRTITYHRSDKGARTYSFLPTETDNAELVLTVVPPEGDAAFEEDLETFNGILTQYANFQGAPPTPTPVPDVVDTATPPTYASIGASGPANPSDLRGHLILVNEDNGEVVGEFDHKFAVREDPKLGEKGRENEPVFIEIPEDGAQALRRDDAHARELFARAIPPDQQNWITKSANILSHTISASTNLLLTTVTAASNYYIAHSTPSPHASSTSLNRSTPSTPGASTSSSPTPPPPPPRALVFLTSEKTRKGLNTVHAVTGQAVQISSKTVGMIDTFVRKAVGGREKCKESRLVRAAAAASPPRTFPGTPTGPGDQTYLSPTPVRPGEKPALPPRRSPSPGPPLLPPRGPDQKPHKLSTIGKVILSADLLLSTLDHSTRQALDVGTERIGAVVGHKYGAEAKESSLMMAGSARNIGLVYVDMKGVGRKAILRTAGLEFVKARVRH